jgi:hypothetical protein
MGRADDAQSAILKDLTVFNRLNADTIGRSGPAPIPLLEKCYLKPTKGTIMQANC